MKLREWTLHEEIGRGGMGIVYRATHDIVPGDHAVKAVKPELLSDAESRQRFLQEAALVVKLRHPNVVTAEMPFEHEGQLYLPMELLAGQPLDDAMAARPGPWPVAAAVRIVAQAAAGLGFAHRQNPSVLHRDVKPGNLQLAPDGTVKVLDFGLAKAVGDRSMTAAGLAVGTPAFIAPEVLNGQRASASGDVYALGVVLFRLLTGRLPIELPAEASSLMAVVMAVGKAHEAGLPTVSSLRADVPPVLSALVASCVAATAQQRPVDGIALSEALIALGAAASPSGSHVPTSPAASPQTAVALPQMGSGSGSGSGPAQVGLTGVALPRRRAATPEFAEFADSEPALPKSGSGSKLGLALVAILLAGAGGAAFQLQRPCEAGQGRTGATWGQCCFPGQHWADGACAGTPTACQEGFEVSGATCTLLACEAEHERTNDGVHCCWPGQSWASGACTGTPSVCPEGFEASGSDCSLMACDANYARTEDGVHCCWPGQSWTEDACKGTPSACPAGLTASADTCEALPEGMVLVPGGPFKMGGKKSLRDVAVAGFFIDKTEVTVDAFKACVDAGACKKPDTGKYCNWRRSGRGEHPINCVDWRQSKAYCAWKSKRLPTEKEWEKAARGTDGRIYPWGNARPTCDLAVMDDGRTRATAGRETDGCGRDSTWPVGSKPAGASPYGALDMSGNV